MLEIKRKTDNYNPSGKDSEVNEFQHFGGCNVRDKIWKVINMNFQKREVPDQLRKTLIQQNKSLASEICS